VRSQECPHTKVWSLYNNNLIAKVEKTSNITQIKSHKNLYLKLKIKIKLQTVYFSIEISLNVIHTPQKTKTHTQILKRYILNMLHARLKF